MKFLKGFLKLVWILAGLAAIGAGIWYIAGDALTGLYQDLRENWGESSAMDRKEYRTMVENTRPLRDQLALASECIGTAEVLECRVSTVSGETGEVIDLQYKNTSTTYDRARNLKRQIDYMSLWTETKILGAFHVNDLDVSQAEQWYYWSPVEDIESLGVCYYPDEGGSQYYTALPDTWYYTYDLANFYHDIATGAVFGSFPSILPAQMEVTGYEELGMETCNGENAMHYVVTHWPLMPSNSDINNQYRWSEDGIQYTHCGPDEYFPWAIDGEIQEEYPAFYQSVMDLVNRHYYEDGESHLWITEDGRLLRAEIDCTLAFYTERLAAASVEDIRWIAENLPMGVVNEYDTMFYHLTPVTRIITYHYGEDAQPIVLPEDAISLVDGEHPEQN